MNDDLIYQTATELLSRMQSEKLDSRTVLERLITRMEQVNPRINAVVATQLDVARRRADEADEARARGENWGPLHGIPLTIKDTFEVRGLRSTAGAKRLALHTPEKNAVAVEKLEQAGAIIFGKTNVPVYASDLQSFNPLYGTTHNPWDIRLTPGGSSGGAAAALAAGLSPLELGSDIAGSIRTPAHFCGVYGHKATQGIIPMRGHIPGPPGMLSEADLAVPGPMARSAADLSLMMDVVCGASPGKEAAWSLSLPQCEKQSLSEFRVLWWMDDPFCELDSRLIGPYQRLKKALVKAGAKVDEGLPAGKGLETYYAPYMYLLGSVMGTSNKKSARRMMGLVAPFAHRFSDRLPVAKAFEHFLAGAAGGHAEWLSMNERRLRMLQRFEKVFAQYDVVLCPVAMTTAFAHSQKTAMPVRTIRVNGEKRHYADLFRWIAPATLMGLPATSAPIGLTEDGMPVNVQIVSATYEDTKTLRFAELLEKAVGGFTPPPALND